MSGETFSVKQARNLAGMTQTQMASRLGICLETYRKLEKNPENMTISQAQVFCDIVKRPINEVRFFTHNSN